MIATALYALGAAAFFVFMAETGQGKTEAAITALFWPVVVIGSIIIAVLRIGK